MNPGTHHCRRTRLAALLCAVLLLSPSSALAQPQGGAYQLTRSVVAGGGGASGAEAQRLEGTIGQATAATSTGGGYAVASGFFSAGGAEAASQPPVAGDDLYAANAGETLSVAAPGVLENDFDPEGGALSASLVSGAANGALTLNADGSFTYTPAAGFSGSDSFTYSASDGGGGSDTATVRISVSQPGATFVVNTTEGAVGRGPCDAHCTLPEAVRAAERAPGPNVITFAIPTTDPGYDAAAGAHTIRLTRELELEGDVTINGPGAGRLVVRGRNDEFEFSAVFVVHAGAAVAGASISGLTITGGRNINGGGVVNAGTLTLTDCVVAGNAAVNFSSDAEGGGIYNAGTLTLVSTTVSGNTSQRRGGGIYNAFEATLRLAGSTVSGNSAPNGGGIYNQNADAEVRASTISGNTAGNFGAGIYNRRGKLALVNSTLADNTAGGAAGGGLYTEGPGQDVTVRASTVTRNRAANTAGGVYNAGGGGLFAVHSSIVAGNTAGIQEEGFNPSDVDDEGGGMTSLGYNLVGETRFSGHVFTQPTDITNVDPKLDPAGLASNGGPTRTVRLLSDSPAVNKGDDALLAAPHNLATDQRGMARKVGAAVDVGAYEVQSLPQTGPTLVVNSTADPGDGVCDTAECTLREAIAAANADAALTSITFALGAGTPSVTLQSSLPVISAPVHIDGATGGATRVEINGNRVATDGLSLNAAGGGSTIRRLVINRVAGTAAGRTGNAIKLSRSDNNTVEGCLLGTNADGTAVTGFTNAVAGVFVFESKNNRIGGTEGTTPGGSCTGACNLISGNGIFGVYVEAFTRDSDSNVISGNFIGTDVTGTAALGNGTGHGVALLNRSHHNLVGGAAPAARNVISGNDSVGILISAGDARGNRVEGNFIGTDTTGTLTLGNGASGAANQPGAGVFLSQGASDNTIGGAAPGAGNLIAFNVGAGVRLGDPGEGAVAAGSGNSILGNSIHSNEALGISLSDGPGTTVKANDAGDADSGTNELQNFPVLSSAASDSSTTRIEGTLNSSADSRFRVEFFSSPTCDPSGHGEGQVFLGSASVTTAGNDAAFTFDTSQPLAAGHFVTATATDVTPYDHDANAATPAVPRNNTSEFSACVAAAAVPTEAFVEFTQTGFGAGENQGPVAVTVRRTGAPQAFSVTLTAASGTATAGADFEDVSRTLHFAAGETEKTVQLALIDDPLFEGEERATLTLTDPTGGVQLGTQSTFGLIIFSDDPLPTASLSPSALHVMEPASGTREVALRLRLSNPSASAVTVTYSTHDATASAAGDYAAIDEATATFRPGETETTVTLTVNSDGVQESAEMFFVALEQASGANTSPPAFVHITTPVAAGGVLVSEFRFRGPDPDGDGPLTGALDEFIELYNNTDADIAVGATDGSGGWAVVAHDGSAATVLATIPGGTVIPARSHYLVANSAGYSLGASPSGDGSEGAAAVSAATPDLAYTSDIPDAAGVALFSVADPAGYADARLDSAGFSSLPPGSPYYEGTPLASPVTAAAEHSFVRRLAAGRPQDTDDNAADFVLVSTDPAAAAGSVLGAPGPENLSSPVQRNARVKASLIDPAVSHAADPNTVRRQCGDAEECLPGRSRLGTFSIRRRWTNNTGANVTALRFRIVNVTAGPAPAGTADLRAITSEGVTGVALAGGGVVAIEGTTLDPAPVQPAGGGLNSTLAAGTVTTSAPLAPGASVNLQFLLGVEQSGAYRFFVNVEAATDSAGDAPSRQKQTPARKGAR
jgi:CSLREA domain-containing protein